MIPINMDDYIVITITGKAAGDLSLLAVVRDEIGQDFQDRTITGSNSLNISRPPNIVTGFYLLALYAWAAGGIGELSIIYKETQRNPPNSLIVVDRYIDKINPPDDYPQYNYMFKA